MLPAEILGQVYEQFLGKVIRLTEGHRAVVEDKPEVKKAGGVKYTPVYIVDAIVKKTLGPTLEGKTPLAVVLISVLDPACGSGSFLIVAYQYLLDWHREWYLKNLVPLLESGMKPSSPEIRRMLPGATNEPGKKGRKKEPELPVFQGRGGEWRLTTAERKRILLNNIYGVDIDRQAVEVTKLSLLLKVLEGENDETISKQLKLFQERALPDLGNNIKCGNSLIGWDILEDNPNLTQEEIERINPFDWDKEFPEIFQRGGFNVVIGNPPYVRQEGLVELKGYLEKHYKVYQGTADLYAYFIERSHKLLHPDGLFGMIISNKWMKANYGRSLRRFIAEQTTLIQIVDFGELPVFQNASTFPAIVLTKNLATKGQQFIYAPIKRLDFASLEDEVELIGLTLNSHSIEGDNWSLATDKYISILKKMEDAEMPLGQYVGGKIYYGIKTGFNDAFIIDASTRDRIIKEDPKSTEIIKPFLVGRDIKRCEPPNSDKYLILMPKGWTRDKSNGEHDAWGWLKRNYPAISDYLIPYADSAEKRYDKGEYWWELRACDYYPEFEKPKIIYPIISIAPKFTLDYNSFYANDKTFFIPCNNLYLLGILNAHLMWFYLKHICSVLGDPNKRGRLELRTIFMEKIPIRTINDADHIDVARHDRMVSLVDNMLSLKKQLKEARTPHEQTGLQRQIEATDRQIDALVYELYGLTEEEIKIVEGDGHE